MNVPLNLQKSPVRPSTRKETSRPFFNFLIFGAILLMGWGCAAPITPRSDLDRMMLRYSGSTINHMFYMGTRRGFHHLRHQSPTGVRVYRIQEDELQMAQPMAYTRDPDSWQLVAVRWWSASGHGEPLGPVD
ncbi:MAG: hypothetical protein JJU29_23535 [Verrucomicrobia bacterium]|nr:hypothetical protein [Verrucomicrobiota bacterium]